MTNESLETQASIMLKNAADHLASDSWDGSKGYENGDWEAITLMDLLSQDVYFSGEWTFGEPLY